MARLKSYYLRKAEIIYSVTDAQDIISDPTYNIKIDHANPGGGFFQIHDEVRITAAHVALAATFELIRGGRVVDSAVVNAGGFLGENLWFDGVLKSNGFTLVVYANKAPTTGPTVGKETFLFERFDPNGSHWKNRPWAPGMIIPVPARSGLHRFRSSTYKLIDRQQDDEGSGYQPP